MSDVRKLVESLRDYYSCSDDDIDAAADMLEQLERERDALARECDRLRRGEPVEGDLIAKHELRLQARIDRALAALPTFALEDPDVSFQLQDAIERVDEILRGEGKEAER